MSSSAPGVTRERPAPEVTRKNTGLALGLTGGILGGIMGLLFLLLGAFGLAIDAEATRAEETAVMFGTVALLGMAALGTVGGLICKSDAQRGANLQLAAAGGGVGVFLLLALVDISGLAGDAADGYVVDAAWLAVGFWFVPGILFMAGAVTALSARSPR